MIAKWLLRAVLLGVVLVPSQASAQFQTGNELNTLCLGEDALDRIECAGYLQGMADLMQILGSIEDDETEDIDLLRACFPRRVTVRQLRDIVGKFMAENLDRRHLPAAALVGLAIGEAFPCGE